VGSRVRIAAAACVVASGLLVGGAGASIAFADPAHSGGGGGKHTDGSSGDNVFEKPKPDPDDNKSTPGDDKGDPRGTADPKPDDDKTGTDDGKNGDNNNGSQGTGNPNCGNNGNSGGNGGAQGCGGGTPPTTDPPTTKPPTTTPPPTKPPGEPEEPGNCEEKNDDDCSPGWPWWPWPWPWDPGQPPAPGGGGGGGAAPEVPSGRPGPPPQMQLPPELMPPASEPPGPSVIDSVPGVGVAAAELPIPPITLPIVVAPAIGAGAPGAPSAPVLPGTPRGVMAEPPAAREPLPANVGSNVTAPASSYRIGYTDYLRNAGLSQVAALAVPGVAGMLVLTGAGGLVGYRQAKAGHAVHTTGTARFVN
jgi:hypothetical protein